MAKTAWLMFALLVAATIYFLLDEDRAADRPGRESLAFEGEDGSSSALQSEFERSNDSSPPRPTQALTQTRVSLVASSDGAAAPKSTAPSFFSAPIRVVVQDAISHRNLPDIPVRLYGPGFSLYLRTDIEGQADFLLSQAGRWEIHAGDVAEHRRVIHHLELESLRDSNTERTINVEILRYARHWHARATDADTGHAIEGAQFSLVEREGSAFHGRRFRRYYPKFSPQAARLQPLLTNAGELTHTPTDPQRKQAVVVEAPGYLPRQVLLAEAEVTPVVIPLLRAGKTRFEVYRGGREVSGPVRVGYFYNAPIAVMPSGTPADEFDVLRASFVGEWNFDRDQELALPLRPDSKLSPTPVHLYVNNERHRRFYPELDLPALGDAPWRFDLRPPRADVAIVVLGREGQTLDATQVELNVSNADFPFPELSAAPAWIPERRHVVKGRDWLYRPVSVMAPSRVHWRANYRGRMQSGVLEPAMAPGETRSLTIHFDTAGLELSGRLIHADGSAVGEGWHLSLSAYRDLSELDEFNRMRYESERYRRSQRCDTNADGRFVFQDLLAGDYFLKAHFGTHRAQKEWTVSAGTQEWVGVVPRMQNWDFYVRNEETQKAVHHATLHYYIDFGPGASPRRLHGKTASNFAGDAHLKSIRAGARFEVAEGGYEIWSRTTEELDDDHPVVVSLQPGRIMEFYFVDAEGLPSDRPHSVMWLNAKESGDAIRLPVEDTACRYAHFSRHELWLQPLDPSGHPLMDPILVGADAPARMEIEVPARAIRR